MLSRQGLPLSYLHLMIKLTSSGQVSSNFLIHLDTPHSHPLNGVLCFLDVDTDNANICEDPNDGGINTPDDDQVWLRWDDSYAPDTGRMGKSWFFVYYSFTACV
jgi:hypothetical protein